MKSQSRDQALYEAWVSNKTPENMEKLINEMSGIIHSAASRFSMGHTPKASLRIKGRSLTAQAIQSYDPTSGVKLSVWVTTYLDKLNRYVGQGSIMKISEDMHNLQTQYYREKSILEQELDRTPTVEEVSDRLGVSTKKIHSIERTFSPVYNDSTTNTNKFLGETIMDEEDVLYAVDQLNEDEQRLFAMKTGFPTGKALNLEEIGKKTGYSAAQISRKLQDVANKLKTILRI